MQTLTILTTATIALGVGGLIFIAYLVRAARRANEIAKQAQSSMLAMHSQVKQAMAESFSYCNETVCELFDARVTDVDTYSKALNATIQLLNEIDATQSMVDRELEAKFEGAVPPAILAKTSLIHTHCQEARTILGSVSFSELKQLMAGLNHIRDKHTDAVDRMIAHQLDS